MQQLPKPFLKWYDALKIVKQNKGPAKGTIATALVVLQSLREKYDLNISTHLAKGGAQIKGASGGRIKQILAEYGETRPYAEEGGRTNRGSIDEIRSLLLHLEQCSLEDANPVEREAILKSMQAYLVSKVSEYHQRQKIGFVFKANASTWHNIQALFDTAKSEGKLPQVAQHLVGAKLQIRFPDIKIDNHSVSASDAATNRPGDFLVGDTSIHVTLAPMLLLFEKCRKNISEGYRPLLLVPDAMLAGARQLASQHCQSSLAVDSLESFVSQNVEELSGFNGKVRHDSLRSLLETYNRRVAEVETDLSLQVEIPNNL